MLDANAELQRLRSRLRFKNLSDKIIDEICDEASMQIQQMTADILADAMNEAVNAGADIPSVEFIDDIRSIRSGSTFDIITESGKTDYSEPPFPMLPSLLKNAKVAKDGSLYKVIPMKQSNSNKSDKRVAPTTEAAFIAIQDARMQAKAQKDQEHGRLSSSPDAMKGMDTVSAMQNILRSRSVTPKEKYTPSNEPVMNFRTASSKQDPNSQWVRPGKSINMGPALRSINERLHYEIDKAIESIIRSYEDMY